MKCETCDEPTFGPLCVYCRGERERPKGEPPPEYSEAEKLPLARRTMGLVEGLMIDKTIGGPHEAVTILLQAASAIVISQPQIPSFEWYARRTAERTSEGIRTYGHKVGMRVKKPS